MTVNPKVVGADQWISRLVGAGLAIVAGVAAVVSYRHMRDLSGRHGEDGLSSTILPLSVDGLLAVAALVLLADARAGRRGGRATAWFAVTLGIGASMAANVAHAEPNWTGRLIGLWAPVALAVALELALRHARHIAAVTDGSTAEDVSSPVEGEGYAGESEIVSVSPAVPPRLVPSQPADSPGTAVDLSASTGHGFPPDLVKIAKEVLAELRLNARSVSASAMARGIRACGGSISTDRAHKLFTHVAGTVEEAAA
ncbi:putative membrane protein [Candidatus Protofrankia californiensis]|uniref:Putative membrane protein n=1 Tax=Candidatus Protofrankia californiensis TaxID=1839754 RepID=A0A1C3NSX9_9ACTN|nr:putative membrane protein [Candidatus Protofrankia californiensis]